MNGLVVGRRQLLHDFNFVVKQMARFQQRFKVAAYRTRFEVDEVANSATVGPNSRFDTLRPAPSWLMDHARDLDTTQVHDLDLALVKGSCFFRGIKALFHDLCHVAPPIQLLQILRPVRAEIQAALFCTQAPRTDQPILARRYPI
jgi:hypothetical protein